MQISLNALKFSKHLSGNVRVNTEAMRLELKLTKRSPSGLDNVNFKNKCNNCMEVTHYLSRIPNCLRRGRSLNN